MQFEEVPGRTIAGADTIWSVFRISAESLAVVTSTTAEIWSQGGNELSPVPLRKGMLPAGVDCSEVWGVPPNRVVWMRRREAGDVIEMVDGVSGKTVFSQALRKDCRLNTAAGSIDGRLLVTLQQHIYDPSDAEMEVRECGTGERVASIPIPQLGGIQQIHMMVVSPDGNTVAFASRFGHTAIGVVSLVSRSVVWHMERRGGPYGIAFDPTGAALYVGDNCGGIARIATGTGKEVWRRDVHVGGLTAWGAGAMERVVAVDVSKDGQYVATAMGFSPRVILWNASSGRQVGVFDTKGASVRIVCFASDGEGMWLCRVQGRKLSFLALGETTGETEPGKGERLPSRR